MKRTGVILAAGLGSRLAGADESTRLKPLTPVAGVPLIQRTLMSLERAGCARIVVVVGYAGDEVRAAAERVHAGRAELVFAHNDKYQLANGVSVLAAAPHVEADFVLTMADHVLGDELMDIARAYTPAPGAAALLVDYKLDTIFDMDDATKVLERDGRIASIGKTIQEFNCVDTGVFVCTRALMDAIESVYARRGDASLSEGVAALAARDDMFVVDVGDGFWQDVDTPEMLAHAERVLGSRS
jgi:1L-myo-inositol 1-phosphate cytidylyltransferase